MTLALLAFLTETKTPCSTSFFCLTSTETDTMKKTKLELEPRAALMGLVLNV